MCRAQLEQQIAEVKGQPGLKERVASLGNRLETEIEELGEWLGEVEDHVDTLQQAANSTPAMGLRKRFACECGAKGLVAVGVVCTACGQESTWGWLSGRNG